MLNLLDREVGGFRVRVVASERSDGDMHPLRSAPDELAERQRDVTGATWRMLDQVHGVAVHDLDTEAHAATGTVARRSDRSATVGRGDVLTTRRSGEHVAIWAADCAAIVLAGSSGRVTAAHGGWKGLSLGIVERACRTIGRDRPETVGAAVLGPVIHACCYEFGERDLHEVAAGMGVDAASIASTTTLGATALDVPAAVRLGLRRHGIELDVVGPCTGCDDRWFSHRARSDAGRHATIGWMERIDHVG